jgi:DNA polymerase II small subunit/DNA polymerase delta subunit B
MAATMQSLQTATRDQYQFLHDAISRARESCVDPSQRDNLRHQADEIQLVLTSLDQADLQSRTAEFEALESKVQCINLEMQNLKREIDKIVQDVAIATKVTAAIDGALTASAKLFA